MIQLYQIFVKVKNVLTTQIVIENVRLTHFLYNRTVSKINSSTCFCDYQKQTIKHIIVSCLLHNKIEVGNEIKMIDYRLFFNTATKLKEFTE